MIQQTSIKNHKPGEPIRQSQNSRILTVLLDFAAVGEPVTVEFISMITEIKQSTVHARLNDLFVGYEQNGVTYYAVRHSETFNTDGNPVNAYTVTTICPEIDSKEHIERLRNEAIAAIIKYRTARKHAVKKLFE